MYIEKNRGPYVYQNNSFQTITVSLIFPFDYKKEDYVKCCLVNDVINRSMNFPEKKDFHKALIQNYIISLNSKWFTVGDTSYIYFDLIIPTPKTVKEVSLEKCFDFLADCIYNPFTINEGFEEIEIERFIKLYKDDVMERNNLIANYANKKINEIAAPNTKLCDSMENHLKDLDEITSKNLYQFYKKKVINNTPFVFVMGDVEEDEIKKLSNKYFFKTNNENIKISEPLNHFQKSNKFESITEEKEFFQSHIALIYKVKNMCEKDRITLSAIDDILNSQVSNLLLDKLRNENDLVYTARSKCQSRYGLLTLTALIHRNSKDKTIEIMKEVIETLKDEEFISPLLENIKNKERIEIIKDKDRRYYLFNAYFVYTTLGWYENPEARYKKLCAVTTKDIKDLADRLFLSYEYFIRGMKDAR